MFFGAHHRPEMTDNLDPVELRERGFGDIFQRLAGGIGQQVQVQSAHCKGQDPLIACAVVVTAGDAMQGKARKREWFSL
jgi:hypothetical protein